MAASRTQFEILAHLRHLLYRQKSCVITRLIPSLSHTVLYMPGEEPMRLAITTIHTPVWLCSMV